MLINLDPSKLQRSKPKKANPTTVERYKQMIKNRVVIPPVKVMYNGDKYIYEEGTVRVEACRQLFRPVVCDIIGVM